LPGPEVWLVLRRHVETGEVQTSLGNAPVDTAAEPQVRMLPVGHIFCFRGTGAMMGMDSPP
jgi:hypothetical protein